jgi:hypothetical protein
LVGGLNFNAKKTVFLGKSWFVPRKSLAFSLRERLNVQEVEYAEEYTEEDDNNNDFDRLFL